MHDLAAQACVGNVDEMPDAGGAVVGLERHAPGIETARYASPKYLDRGLRIQRNLQGAPEVAASAQWQHRQSAGRVNRRAVVKEAVDDLVEGAVAADRHDHRAGFSDCTFRHLCRLEGPS